MHCPPLDSIGKITGKKFVMEVSLESIKQWLQKCRQPGVMT